MQQPCMRNAVQVANASVPMHYIHHCRQTNAAMPQEVVHEAGKVVQYRMLRRAAAL